ncbi:MAG: PSD1 and planctomycete cytochrome C domain-containing protein [Verrucomicrobiota bacterium]
MKAIPLLLLTISGVSPAIAASPDAKVDFNRDVRPILSDNCFYCHGNDASHRKGKLRLDIREEALKKEAFAPGKAQESELIKRILTSDKDDLMPPEDSHKKLTDAEKEILKRWIDQGAEYKLHWSYEKPVKAAVSPNTNGVDFLVQSRLQTRSLKASPEADRRTLIRRLYFDLLGLPPTPEEVSAFENDPAPDAYPKLVERVLANPHYGERMAIGWLDVVRFADTIGYHSDNPRNVWPYRDWVIQSFNKNKRFDQFTLEQVAGDLLPNATEETRIGSAFNRLLLSTEEGGAQAKDYEQRMLTDRVRAIGAAWLGQTTGCAQCHDHKFDPFSTRDFYSLGAFFADIKEPILGRREDGMVIGTPEQLKQLAAVEDKLANSKKKFEAIRAQLDSAQKQWEADLKKYDVTLPELKDGAKSNDPEVQKAKKAAAALRKEPKDRKKPDQDAIRDYFLAHGTELFKPERDALDKSQAERDAVYNPLAKCLVSVHTDQKRTVRILPRGNWMDESGEVVKAALPHYLPQPTIKDREPTRLDLAQWLVSKENPLTARTVMNRLWKQLFGTGLSKVLDDLGAQGELPPNQPLLDWLACEFMDHGWDFKHMVRTIVNSATYKQVSTATPELTAADPYNRELARQSPFRLDAELVRDNALALSKLLVPKIGGPSVKPYQPEGYWDNLNFPVRTYLADKGENQFRRGIYTWWQRSFLHPSLLAFDAPNREECSAERNRSNIPQQALILLNDPTYVEAARVLAARVLTECNGTTEQRLDWTWKQVLQRAPSPEEKATLAKVFSERFTTYQAAPESADALLKVGETPTPTGLPPAELAAWTHVVRVLLNLHETITRA